MYPPYAVVSPEVKRLANPYTDAVFRSMSAEAAAVVPPFSIYKVTRSSRASAYAWTLLHMDWTSSTYRSERFLRSLIHGLTPDRFIPKELTIRIPLFLTGCPKARYTVVKKLPYPSWSTLCHAAAKASIARDSAKAIVLLSFLVTQKTNCDHSSTILEMVPSDRYFDKRIWSLYS